MHLLPPLYPSANTAFPLGLGCQEPPFLTYLEPVSVVWGRSGTSRLAQGSCANRNSEFHSCLQCLKGRQVEWGSPHGPAPPPTGSPSSLSFHTPLVPCMRPTSSTSLRGSHGGGFQGCSPWLPGAVHLLWALGGWRRRLGCAGSRKGRVRGGNQGHPLDQFPPVTCPPSLCRYNTYIFFPNGIFKEKNTAWHNPWGFNTKPRLFPRRKKIETFLNIRKIR